MNWKLANIDKPLLKYRVSNTQIKFHKIKQTILNTYLIQKKAIYSYGYDDYFFNKFLRFFIRTFLFYPKSAYYLYKLYLKLNNYQKVKYSLFF